MPGSKTPISVQTVQTLGTQLRHVHLIVYIVSILHVAHILLQLMGNGPQNVCRLLVTSKAL